MSFYTPEEWIIVKINSVSPHYRIFGSWRGSYTGSDSWRMNSGVTAVEVIGDYYMFNGSSGSIYKCHKKTYGIRSPYNASVLAEYKAKGKKMFKVFSKMPKILAMDWLI